MKRVGNAITFWPRTIVTCPSSSGWRSASSDGRANSDSSSRNSTPWWASVASPGVGCEPPPTRPEAEIVWCGARNGRTVARPPPSCRPPTDWIRVTSIASAARERRQDRRQPPREHRLARAGRPVQVEVVAARGGDLERRDQPVVAAHVREVQRRGRLGDRPARAPAGRAARPRRAGTRRPPRAWAAPSTSSSGTSAASAATDARERAAGAGRGGGAPSAIASVPRTARSSPVSDSSPTTAQPSSSSAATSPPATSSAIASGRSKPGPILRRSAGREVDRDPRLREHEARVHERRAHALARLPDRLVGEPDDGERRQALGGCRPRPRRGGSSRRRPRRC